MKAASQRRTSTAPLSMRTLLHQGRGRDPERGRHPMGGQEPSVTVKGRDQELQGRVKPCCTPRRLTTSTRSTASTSPPSKDGNVSWMQETLYLVQLAEFKKRLSGYGTHEQPMGWQI